MTAQYTGGLNPRGEDHPFVRTPAPATARDLLLDLRLIYRDKGTPPFRVDLLRHFGRPGGWEDQGDGHQCDIVLSSADAQTIDTSEDIYVGWPYGETYYHEWRNEDYVVTALQRLVMRAETTPTLATEGGLFLTTEDGRLLTITYADPAGPPPLLYLAEGELNNCVTTQQPTVVRSMTAVGQPTTADGVVVLEAGDGIELTAVNPHQIRITRTANTACVSPETALRTLGGAKPDDNGAVFIRANDCLEVAPMVDAAERVAGVLLLGEHCSPALPCDRLVDLYDVRIRQLLGQAHELAATATDIRQQYLEVLAAAMTADTCTEQNPLLLQAVSFSVPPAGPDEPPGKLVVFAVTLGNGTLINWPDVTVLIKLDVGGTTPTVVPGSPAGIKTAADGTATTIAPVWPTTTVNFACVPPYRHVLINGSLVLKPSPGSILGDVEICVKAFSAGAALPLNYPTQQIICRTV